MTNDEPSVAILGAGRIGMFHAENIVNNVSGLTLKAVAEPVPEVAERAHERLGVEAEEDWRVVVQDPGIDAVVIASPTDSHAEQIVGAIEAGKHIFCEKPIARNLPSIDELLARVEERGLKFQTGFNRRFDQNFGALRSRMENGEIGDVWMVKITSRDPEPPPLSYLMDSGGLFFDMAIHDFDMARFLVDAEVADVTARGVALVGPETSEADDVDTAFTILQFENGVLGLIENCRQAAYGYDQRIEALGRDGMLLADNERSDTVTIADSSGFHRVPAPRFFRERYSGSYVRQLERFRDALAGEPVTAASGSDGRQAVLVAHAAEMSRREGRTVALDEAERDAQGQTDAKRIGP